MRKVIVSDFVTLDGVFDADTGSHSELDKNQLNAWLVARTAQEGK